MLIVNLTVIRDVHVVSISSWAALIFRRKGRKGGDIITKLSPRGERIFKIQQFVLCVFNMIWSIFLGLVLNKSLLFQQVIYKIQVSRTKSTQIDLVDSICLSGNDPNLDKIHILIEILINQALFCLKQGWTQDSS